MESLNTIPPRYKIRTPLFTPEYYFSNPIINNYKVVGVHVPSDISSHPQIIVDYPDKIVEDVFGETNIKIIPLSSMYHSYFDPALQYTISRPNYIMTHLLRIISQQQYGERMADSFYGDAVIFGSYNHKYKYIDNNNNSAPFEILEQLIHIYEIYANSKNPQAN